MEGFRAFRQLSVAMFIVFLGLTSAAASFALEPLEGRSIKALVDI